MKILTVVGARPQFVKAAVLRQKCDAYNIQEVLVHTGQHYDHAMSDVFFGELNIRPAEYQMQLSSRSHGGMTGEILAGVEDILHKEKPDWCVVYGDTNSTVAAALAAAKLHVPICHIEAGLRSFNKRMPEEINRILTDHMSDLLFCSTQAGVENLKNENIQENVHHVGDIMYDAVKMFTQAKGRSAIVSEFSLDAEKPIALITLHRAETVSDGDRFKRVLEYIRKMSETHQLVFPVHPNTRQMAECFELSFEGFTILEPLPYLSMQSLLSISDVVVTDSGGVQKEAYFHGVRCVTMREETEWVETIDNGWNRLWTQEDYVCEEQPISEYGTGQSADLMLDRLSKTG